MVHKLSCESLDYYLVSIIIMLPGKQKRKLNLIVTLKSGLKIILIKKKMLAFNFCYLQFAFPIKNVYNILKQPLIH